MWHKLDTKQFSRSILFNKTHDTSDSSKNDDNTKINNSLKNPMGEKVKQHLKHNGLDVCFSTERSKADIYLCKPCGRNFRFKCLFFKHQLSCVKLNKRKRNNKVRQKTNQDTFIAKGKAPYRKTSVSSSESFEFRFCSTCSKSFFSNKEYDMHLQLGCGTEEVYTCTECNDVFNSAGELQLHESYCKAIPSLSPEAIDTSEDQQKMFKCRCCKSSFHFPELLKVHLQENETCTKMHHFSMKVECMKRREKHCGPTARKSFSSPAHHQTQYGSNYKSTPKLSDSEKIFKQSSSSVGGSARKSCHNSFSIKQSEYPCRKCGIKFSSPAQLKLHAKRHFKPFPRDDSVSNQCPECQEEFSDLYQLIQHQTDFDHYGMTTKSLVSTCNCPYCKKKFLHVQTRNAHLRNHKEKTLPEIREFVNSTTCGICFRNFGTEALKEQHAHVAHSDSYADSSNRQMANLHSKSISKPLKFAGNTKLEILDKVPDSIESLLKKVPNACPICLKGFDSNFARNRHFRLHILDGVYKCEFCPVKFPRANHLASHVQSVHKEFLKYECKECGARFSSRLTVLQHVTKMHAELPNSDQIEECSIPSGFDDDEFHSERRTREDTADASFKQQFYCDVCKLNFLKLCGLRRHQASKLHNRLLETQNQAKEKIRDLQLQFPPRSATPPVIDYGKQFTCSVCTKEFADVHKFIPHRLSHFNAGNKEIMDEVEPYICEVCGKLMDNYQKIQLHLFWHLQDVQSQAGKSKNFKAKKSVNSSNSLKLPSTPISAQLAGQAVAKKSIRSSGKKEIVIAGVKKPLFTCNDCSISFPSKHHYFLHLQKYCRARKKSPANSLDDTDNATANEKGAVNCWKCDELFQDKKTLVDHERTCMLKVRNKYCAECGCLFSSATLYREHKAVFCTSEFSVFIVDDDDVQQNMETVKNTMKTSLNIAGCVQCKVMFSTIQMLSQHMKNHKLTDKKVRVASWEDDDMDSDVSANTKQGTSSSNFRKRKLSELSLHDDLMEHSDLDLVKITNGNVTGDDFFSVENSQESFYPSSEAEDNSCTETANNSEDNTEITKLRHNFSRLLNAIVSDTSLMNNLGFGERCIDDVLISVLEKMSLIPVDNDDDSLSELDKFRCNIRTLLDVCIKDQIMDFISDYETTTDDIVLAALKMFGVESEKSNKI